MVQCSGNRSTNIKVIHLNIFFHQVFMCHVSGVRCHMSGVTCQVSHVTCHISLMPTAPATDPPTAKLPQYAEQDAAVDLDLDPKIKLSPPRFLQPFLSHFSDKILSGKCPLSISSASFYKRKRRRKIFLYPELGLNLSFVYPNFQPTEFHYIK